MAPTSDARLSFCLILLSLHRLSICLSFRVPLLHFQGTVPLEVAKEQPQPHLLSTRPARLTMWKHAALNVRQRHKSQVLLKEVSRTKADTN
jgi:hypothetical protein